MTTDAWGKRGIHGTLHSFVVKDVPLLCRHFEVLQIITGNAIFDMFSFRRLGP